MIPNTFQLKPVREDAKILTANALQWAAFGGHAHVVKYLMSDAVGMNKEDEAGFGHTPLDIATSHRIGLEGDFITDQGEVQSLLEDETPLCATTLQKAVT